MNTSVELEEVDQCFDLDLSEESAAEVRRDTNIYNLATENSTEVAVTQAELVNSEPEQNIQPIVSPVYVEVPNLVLEPFESEISSLGLVPSLQQEIPSSGPVTSVEIEISSSIPFPELECHHQC